MCAKQQTKAVKKNQKIDYVKVFNSHPELYPQPFRLANVVTTLWGNDQAVNQFEADNVLKDWLDESSEFIALYNEIEDDYFWHHLPTYFEGNEFCVKPTEDEIEAGILYPGHRFIPFISNQLHASEAVLFDGKTKITQTKVTATLDKLVLYHSLLGQQGMIEYLIFDDDDNMLNFSSDKIPEFSVTVMELSDFYRKHNFTYGDMIMMRVDSYNQGKLSMRYRSSADETATDKGKILKWCALFEEGLADAISKNNTDMDIHEELTIALICHADFLIKNPVINIGGFLALTKKYSLKPLSTGALFWYADSDPKIDDDLDINFDDLATIIKNDMSDLPDVDSLDAILRYMGFDFREDEVEAYIRDELFHGGKSYKNVMQRCLDDRVSAFPECETYAKALDKHFALIWENVSASYNRFADGNNGKIRAQALRIKDQQTTWMRNLSTIVTDIRELPKSFMELAKASGHISQILVMLNECDSLSAKEYQQMVATLDAFEVMSENMMHDIHATLDR